MKRKIIIAAAALAAATAADAREVSAVRAREIAASVIPSISEGTAPRRAPGLKDDEPSPYYLFNARSSGGYVIVAGDDRLPAVLGYSLEGSIDPDDMPDALKFLLEMSTASIEGQPEGAVNVSTGTPVVEPLLGDIKWGQSEPFNSLCPMVSGKRGYVGCVATAMAQIMRYYGYPAQGKGSHSYTDGGQTLSADFGSTAYDWANMPNAIPDSPTDAQTAAYSTLCYHLGVATEMTYAASGSGAYTMMVPGALRDHFGYTSSLRMHLRTYYNTDEWMDMIRAELDAGRPVYYSASSEDGQGGHAFVCDGYDSEGYVHMNWGWYGSSNGYFYINHLNPGELGTGGGGGAYNISQEILTNFMPAVAEDKTDPAIYADTRFSCDSFSSGMTIMCYVGNLDTDAFDGEIMAVVTDADGRILRTLKTEGLTVAPFKKGVSGTQYLTMRDIPLKVGSELPAGNYRLRLAYFADGMEAPKLLRHPIGLPSYRECTVINGEILLTAKHEPYPNVTMTSPLSPDGEIYAGGSARFGVNVRNDSEDFRLSTVVLSLENISDPAIACSKEYYVNVYDLSSDYLTMAIDLPDNIVPGKYRVTLAHKNHADKPFATFDSKETIVEVLPAVENPVIRFTSAPVWQNGSTGAATSFERGQIIYIAAQAKNYAAAGETMVICRLVNAEGKSAVLRADSRSWAKGEQRTLAISTYVTADPGTYTMAFSYIGANGLEMPIAADEQTIEVTESDMTPFEVIALDMPSAIKKGDKVNCSITIRGLATVRGTLYIRVRQFTNTSGEIVCMKPSLSVSAGEDQVINFSYRPGSDLADGKYMTIVEFKELGMSTSVPAGGHDTYYKEIAIGETLGIGAIEADSPDVPVEWYTLQGIKVASPSSPGVYIRRSGSIAEKIIIR